MSSIPSTVHPLARSAFSVSGSSGLYDRARPTYPEEAISLILSTLSKVPSGSPKKNVVELGAGTGIFTRHLIINPPAPFNSPETNPIGELKAVEPAEGMRKGFEDKVTKIINSQEAAGGAQGAKVTCVDGQFDHIPVEDGWADLVVVAQAFHWVGKDIVGQEAAVKEIGRALKPGGIWALIWNLEDRDSTAWVAQLRDTYEVFEQGTPQYRLGYWKTIFNTKSYSELFSPDAPIPEAHTWNRGLPATKALVVDRALSKSFITALSDEEKKQVTADVEKIVDRGQGMKFIGPKEEGVFEYPYSTDLWILTRK